MGLRRYQKSLRPDHGGQRDGERAGSRRGRARSAGGRGAGNHVHRVAGAYAHDTQHVQNSRRAAAGRVPCGHTVAGRPRVVDIRRPPGRHGLPCHGIRLSGLVYRAGGPGPRYGGPPGRHKRLVAGVPYVRRMAHLKPDGHHTHHPI